MLTWCGMVLSVRDMTVVSLFPHRLAQMPMAGMPMSMQPCMWSLGCSFVVLIMWWVMMIAMMTPFPTPIIPSLSARRSARPSHRIRSGKSSFSTAAFAGGYLLVRLAFHCLQLGFDGQSKDRPWYPP